MTTPDHFSDDVLAQWLTGELSPQAQADLERRLQQDPAFGRQLTAMREAFTPFTNSIAVDASAATERLKSHITTQAQEKTQARARTVPRPSVRRRTWITGAIAGIAGIAGIVITTRHPATPVRDGMGARTYTTTNGERAIIELVDGTRVTLNVASRLDIPEGFGTTIRDLSLQGEAAFAITHSAGTPFTVRANDTKTTVLGTEFAIRAYETDTTVQVAVRSGRVNTNGSTLLANEVARFGDAFTEVRRDQPVNQALAFVEGRLVIFGTTLGNAVPQLERWYDVEIRFGSPELANRRLDATLQSTSQTDLIATLELALYARVVSDGRTLTLYSR